MRERVDWNGKTCGYVQQAHKTIFELSFLPQRYIWWLPLDENTPRVKCEPSWFVIQRMLINVLIWPRATEKRVHRCGTGRSQEQTTFYFIGSRGGTDSRQLSRERRTKHNILRSFECFEYETVSQRECDLVPVNEVSCSSYFVFVFIPVESKLFSAGNRGFLVQGTWWYIYRLLLDVDVFGCARLERWNSTYST